MRGVSGYEWRKHGVCIPVSCVCSQCSVMQNISIARSRDNGATTFNTTAGSGALGTSFLGATFSVRGMLEAWRHPQSVIAHWIQPTFFVGRCTVFWDISKLAVVQCAVMAVCGGGGLTSKPEPVLVDSCSKQLSCFASISLSSYVSTYKQQ